METTLRQANTLDTQQLARICKIRDSWSLQERKQRQRVSNARQQWLADLVLSATNRHPHASPELHFSIPVDPAHVVNTIVGNAPRKLSAK